MITENQYTNAHGNTVCRDFIAGASRYLFDFTLCRTDEGWQQFDTDQDAWYFGIWVHSERREFITYAEGDITRVSCPTRQGYAAELKAMCEAYGPAPMMVTLDLEKGETTRHFQNRAALLPPEMEG